MHGLDAVERVTPAVAGLAQRCVHSTLPIRGALTLATCNRVELLLDVDQSVDDPLHYAALDAFVESQLTHHERPFQPNAEHCTTLTQLREHGLMNPRTRETDHAAAVHTLTRIPVDAKPHRLADAVTHIFEVAAGLDSMVVGEREISGQLRRALAVAGQEETASTLIHRVVDAALRTSRKIAHLTGLASAGRSVVGVGLDVVERYLPPLRECRVLLIGTGSYAGASVAGLHARGCMDIHVYSTSGRAARFAAGHDLSAVPTDGLLQALTQADLVVSCRGVGAPVLRVADVREVLKRREGRRLYLLDLALVRDVEAGVGQLPGVKLIDLKAVRDAVPNVGVDQVSRAIDLVHQGTADLARELDQRRLDPAIVAVRSLVEATVEDEIERLPATATIARDAVIHALRRLAARMAHIPTARAHDAAGAGRAEEYVAALHEVFGIDAPLGEHHLAARPSARRRQLHDAHIPEAGRCPATGMVLADLGKEKHE
ncbi:MAG: glutamyl-tRNA reductase [Bowdeniella nasicola]|nr:glutamyl-tRNA reductase [Bowdeniella nasicola]